MILICMYVCMYVYFLNCTQPRNPARSSESFYATRIDPPKGGSMILVTKPLIKRDKGEMYVCMYVCIFIKLHITA